MRTINVLATQPIIADDRAKIEASDPEIRWIDAGGWFDGEIGETWTAFAAARYLPPGANNDTLPIRPIDSNHVLSWDARVAKAPLARGEGICREPG